MNEERNSAKLAKAESILRKMFGFLGLEADVSGEVASDGIAIKIASSDAGRIIGRRGQNLESIQLLLSRIIFKGEEEVSRITIDIDGYARENAPESPRPQRRSRGGEDDDEPRGGRSDSGYTESQLRQRAIDAGKEVKRWGEPVLLPKMNAHDRRIIHVTLQDDPELVTESSGEGALKRVVVSLRKTEA